MPRNLDTENAAAIREALCLASGTLSASGFQLGNILMAYMAGEDIEVIREALVSQIDAAEGVMASLRKVRWRLKREAARERARAKKAKARAP